MQWQFRDMRLTQVAGEVQPWRHLRNPLRPQWRIAPSILPLRQGAVFTTRYECTAYDSSEPPHRVASLGVSLAFTFTTPVEPTVDQCRDHVPVVLRMAEPYLRETIHSLTSWMGLPPLVIDLSWPALAVAG